VTVEAGCGSIGMKAFAGCSSLNGVVIRGCGDIGMNAFSDCPALTTATIARGCTVRVKAFDHHVVITRILFTS
jgi:hypothetical protein